MPIRPEYIFCPILTLILMTIYMSLPYTWAVWPPTFIRPFIFDLIPDWSHGMTNRLTNLSFKFVEIEKFVKCQPFVERSSESMTV